jgi:hypothetical protein
VTSIFDSRAIERVELIRDLPLPIKSVKMKLSRDLFSYFRGSCSQVFAVNATKAVLVLGATLIKRL